jgi:HEPN domain-containing protein
MTTSDEHENYKKVALERFYDAVVLYRAGRYSASLYMSGYVIEIGIKYKLVELTKLPLNEVNHQSIVYLLTKQPQEPLPKDFRGLLSLVQTQKDIGKQSHVKVVVDPRYPIHDNRKFLEELLDWYRVLDHAEKETLEKFYNSPEFLELYPKKSQNNDSSSTIKLTSITQWSTELRYEVPQEQHKEDVEKHLKLCADFLITVLKYSESDIEHNVI